MTGVIVLPSSVFTERSNGFENFVPNLKIFPISDARNTSYGFPERVRSPAFASLIS